MSYREQYDFWLQDAYFDEKTKVELLNKIYDHMAPGGYLFIGTTESMNRNATKFQYVEPSIYKK